MRRFALAILSGAGALLLSGAASAQSTAPADPVDQKVQERVETQRKVYGVQDPRERCRAQAGDEIVVCGDDGKDQRLPRSAPDPNTLEGRRELNNGIPRAPQFDKGYCASCQHFGKVPPPVYYVDVTKLPQAPAGSDAEAVAKGELSPR